MFLINLVPGEKKKPKIFLFDPGNWLNTFVYIGVAKEVVMVGVSVAVDSMVLPHSQQGKTMSSGSEVRFRQKR